MALSLKNAKIQQKEAKKERKPITKLSSKALPPDYLKLLMVAEENAGKTFMVASMSMLPCDRYQKDKDAKVIIIATETETQYLDVLHEFEDFNEIEVWLCNDLDDIETCVANLETMINENHKQVLGVGVDNITDVWDYHIERKAKQLGKEKLNPLDYVQPNVWHQQLIFRVAMLRTNVVFTGNIKQVYSDIYTPTDEVTHNVNKKVWKKLPNRLELMDVTFKNNKPVYKATLTKNKKDRSVIAKIDNPSALKIVEVLDQLSEKKKKELIQ